MTGLASGGRQVTDITGQGVGRLTAPDRDNMLAILWCLAGTGFGPYSRPGLATVTAVFMNKYVVTGWINRYTERRYILTWYFSEFLFKIAPVNYREGFVTRYF